MGKNNAPAKRKSASQATVHGKNAEMADAGGLYIVVRAILDEACCRASRLVDVEMVRAYMLVGQAIVRYEQQGRSRAG